MEELGERYPVGGCESYDVASVVAGDVVAVTVAADEGSCAAFGVQERCQMVASYSPTAGWEVRGAVDARAVHGWTGQHLIVELAHGRMGLIDLDDLVVVHELAVPAGTPLLVPDDDGDAGAAIWFTRPSADPGVWLDLDTRTLYRVPPIPDDTVVHGSVVQPHRNALFVWGGRTNDEQPVGGGWFLDVTTAGSTPS